MGTRIDEIAEALKAINAEKRDEVRKLLGEALPYKSFRVYQQCDTALSRILKLKGVRIGRKPEPEELFVRAEEAGIRGVAAMREYRSLIPENVLEGDEGDIGANAAVLCSMWPTIKQALIGAVGQIHEIVEHTHGRGL